MTIRNESAANETMAMRASVDALERARWAAVLGSAKPAQRQQVRSNRGSVFAALLPAAAVLGALFV